MTVKQLKDELSKYPDNMDVWVDIFGTAVSDYEYEPVHELEKKEIPFYDEENDLEFKDTVIVITTLST